VVLKVAPAAEKGPGFFKISKTYYMVDTTQEIKVGDVFHVRYTDAYREGQRGRDLHHCFEGLAIAKKSESGVVLVDTFWGLNGNDHSKVFYQPDIGEKISIERYCNLDEITKISRHEVVYYADEDIIFLHDQHACVDSCKYYYIKTGAVRSRAKMVQVVQEQISEAENAIASLKRSIEVKMETLGEIESGKPLEEIYI
jgi:hypothetical protein